METGKLRKKLIISGDDFGISQAANDNILSLSKAGKLDRVSVLIDEYFSQSEISALSACGAKIDLHLNLPLGIKVNRHKYGESALKRSFIFLLKYFLRQISPDKMEKEWERQIDKFETMFGKKPDGLNSHQHIHYFPAYFKIVLRLAKKRGIKYVRFGKTGLLDSSNNVYRILSRLQKKNKRLFSASELHSSDFMASLDWLKDVEKFLKNLPDGQLELVVHPERKDEFKLVSKHF